jgi:UDP-N-acetyl-2-amino-2-deoxyglucuronate dehydrogenase
MTETPTTGFALLGTGMVAEFHRQAIAANAGAGARLVAVSHYDPSQFAEIEERFGVPCLNFEEVIGRSDVDVLSICTPSGQHAEQAIQAAEAGKHVLVEKPMALTLRDADRMIEASERAGVKLGVVLNRRAEPIFRRIREAIVEGDLGELTLGVVTLPYYRGQAYFDSGAWRGTWSLDGGGVLMNQGIHIIDLLVWYLGDPVEVYAFGGTRYRQIEVEDVAASVIHFESGAMATISATTTAEPGFPHRIEIYGTRGGIQVEGESVVRWSLVEPDRARVAPIVGIPAADAGSGGDPRNIAPTGHIGIVRDFIEAIRAGRLPMVDGAEGRRSLAAVLAIYDAAGLRT